MSEYYAVIRSTDHLAHYGVKGMHWGVRKAIEKGNAKRLERNYRKAAKKLKKLNEKANVGIQNENAEKYNKMAKRSAKIGAAGFGGLAGLIGANHLSNLAYAHHLERASDLSEKAKRASKNYDYVNSVGYAEASKYHDKMADTARGYVDDIDRINRRSGIPALLAGVGVAGIGTAAALKAKSYAAKKRTTTKGHAKAVAKRDTWQKEMKSAFKGTEYAKLPNQNKPKRRKRR